MGWNGVWRGGGCQVLAADQATQASGGRPLLMHVTCWLGIQQVDRQQEAPGDDVKAKQGAARRAQHYPRPHLARLTLCCVAGGCAREMTDTNVWPQWISDGR